MPVSCFEKFARDSRRRRAVRSKILLFDEIARPLAALVISGGFLAAVSINLAIRSPSFLCRLSQAIRLDPGSSPIGYSVKREKESILISLMNLRGGPREKKKGKEKGIAERCCYFGVCSKYELRRKSFIAENSASVECRARPAEILIFLINATLIFRTAFLRDSRERDLLRSLSLDTWKLHKLR